MTTTRQISAPKAVARTASKTPPTPAHVKAAVAAQRAQHPKPKAKDADDLGATTVAFTAANSVKKIAAELAKLDDAGLAVVVADNASLWSVEYGYHTRKGRDAWLHDKPADGQLTLRVVLTPSHHVADVPEADHVVQAPSQKASKAAWDAYGKAWEKADAAYTASCNANAKQFALSNHYYVDVKHNGKLLQRVEFRVNGKTPEWSTVSPPITIDLNKYKGDITIEGAAHKSAGPGGYTEGRVTVLHNS